jgi:hypothetical protein
MFKIKFDPDDLQSHNDRSADFNVAKSICLRIIFDDKISEFATVIAKS